MKKFLDPDFIKGFLIFCVIQPGLLIFAVSLVAWGLWTY